MFIKKSIKINAPQATVWEVVTDVEQWPRWTPTVTTIHLADEGPLRLGSIVRIKQPGQPEAQWTVTEFAPKEYFAWESQRFGLKFRASHSIVSDGTHSTSILKLEATGIISILLYPLLRPAIDRALEEENKGLKQKCEEYSK